MKAKRGLKALSSEELIRRLCDTSAEAKSDRPDAVEHTMRAIATFRGLKREMLRRLAPKRSRK